jgi:1-acyl-sn-glycerol-3-phosphate acyltransferase
VIPIGNWGAYRIFDSRTGKLRLGRRAPVSVTAGPPVDLSQWAGATPTRAVLDQMTDAIMLDIRGLVAGLRGEEPPPLYDPPGRRNPTPRDAT